MAKSSPWLDEAIRAATSPDGLTILRAMQDRAEDMREELVMAPLERVQSLQGGIKALRGFIRDVRRVPSESAPDGAYS